MTMLLRYIIIIFLIGIFDWLLGQDYSLWALYLFPLGLAVWNLGLKKAWGLIVIILIQLILVQAIYDTHVVLSIKFLWVILSRLICLGVLSWAIERLRNKEINRIFVPPADR